MSRADDSTPLSVSYALTADHAVVTIGGELDVASAGALGVHLGALRPFERPVALDLAAVTFLDSTGLRGLLQARQWSIEDTGVPASITASSGAAENLLRLSGVSSMFDLGGAGAP